MMEEVRPLSATENTPQEFTVLFWEDRTRLGRTDLPLGQVSAEVLNLTDTELLELRHLANGMLEAVSQRLWNPETKKDRALVLEVQGKVNAVLDCIFTLPLYRQLELDREPSFTLLPSVFDSAPAEFQAMVSPGTPEQAVLWEYYFKLTRIADELITFRLYISTLLDFFFERLKRHNAESYAVALFDFLRNSEVQHELEKVLPSAPVFEFRQAHPAMLEYTTLPSPDDPQRYVVAERLVFHSAAAFLHTDFFRGLMHGNTPRRCHNCGRFFLLERGYNTCYCNAPAPNDPKGRTCRAVGAHRKAASGNGKPPAQLEYAKVYNRLKQRKRRGKISLDEWNEAVGTAQDYLDQALRGELSDQALRDIYRNM